jgi:hypothetical protein
MKSFMKRLTPRGKEPKPHNKTLGRNTVLSLIITALILTGGLVYLLPALVSHTTGNDTSDSIDDWFGWAQTSWKYFQPGVGVSYETGLCFTNSDSRTFTDRELGMYLSAVISAQRLGLLSKNNAWGSDFRIEKILTFLETRSTTSDRLPYAQYNSQNGNISDGTNNQTASASGFGFLLLALDDLENFRPDLAHRVGTIVTRYNTEKFAQSDYFATNNYYPFFLTQGYQTFGFSTPKLKDLNAISTSNTSEESTTEIWNKIKPLILAILKDKTNNSQRTLADNIFSVQEQNADYYLNPKTSLQLTEMAFTYHAMYNGSFTQGLIKQVTQLATEEGYLENTLVNKTSSEETNSIILQAAYYATFSKPTLVMNAPTPTFPRYAVTTFVLAPERIDEQMQLLREIGAYNVTIVTRESTTERFQTVYNAAKNITNCIIPEFSFMQSLPTSWREGAVDSRFKEFKLADGTYPAGVFSFQTDTYTLDYLRNKYNVTFAIGNVWDQINMDSMSIRGGLSTPYYASQRNSMVPSRTTNDTSMLVLPPFTIAPTDRYHYDFNHIIDLYLQGIDMQEFKYTTINHPFFTPFFIELDWLVNLNNSDLTRLFVGNYKWVYQNFEVVTAQQFTNLFRNRFLITPEYHFTYTSSNATSFPETYGEKIEWLMNPSRRIARINNIVISAIDYNAQSRDPYLTKNKTLYFNEHRFGEDPNNMITTSLTFKIDAIWQSQFGDRTLTQKNNTTYTGDLKDFPLNEP